MNTTIEARNLRVGDHQRTSNGLSKFTLTKLEHRAEQERKVVAATWTLGIDSYTAAYRWNEPLIIESAAGVLDRVTFFEDPEVVGVVQT